MSHSPHLTPLPSMSAAVFAFGLCASTVTDVKPCQTTLVTKGQIQAQVILDSFLFWCRVHSRTR